MCDAQDSTHSQEERKTKNSFPFLASFPLHSHTRKPAWKPHAKPPVFSLNDKFIVRTKFTFRIHKSILFLPPFLLFFFKHSGSNPVQYSVQCNQVGRGSCSHPFVLFVPISQVCSSFKYQENIWARLVEKTLLCLDVVPKNQRDSKGRIRFRFYHQSNIIHARVEVESLRCYIKYCFLPPAK